jgi:hypothetical protein
MNQSSLVAPAAEGAAVAPVAVVAREPEVARGTRQEVVVRLR